MIDEKVNKKLRQNIANLLNNSHNTDYIFQFLLKYWNNFQYLKDKKVGQTVFYSIVKDNIEIVRPVLESLAIQNSNTAVKYDPTKVDKNQIVEAINKTGYKVIEKPDEK